MSTGVIVAIVVIVALILLALFVLMPRMKAKKQERELVNRRKEVAGAHREEADQRAVRAEQAVAHNRAHAMRGERLGALSSMERRGHGTPLETVPIASSS